MIEVWIIFLTVYLKWLTLNLVHKDKIGKQYGYLKHSISQNRQISRCSGKKIFPLLSLGWYPITVVSYNGYLLHRNAFSIFTNDNVSDTSWVIPLVSISFLDFVMIHWVCWIQQKSVQGKLYWPIQHHSFIGWTLCNKYFQTARFQILWRILVGF